MIRAVDREETEQWEGGDQAVDTKETRCGENVTREKPTCKQGRTRLQTRRHQVEGVERPQQRLKSDQAAGMESTGLWAWQSKDVGTLGSR